MDVRRAHTLDVGNIVNFLEEYHKESPFKDIPFCRQTVAELCLFAIKDKDSTGLVCYDEESRLLGVLLGSTEPVFFNKERRYATDLLFVAKGGGPYLLKRFIRWARSQNVDRIIMGISTGDQRAEQLYEIMGLERSGGMYVLR